MGLVRIIQNFSKYCTHCEWSCLGCLHSCVCGSWGDLVALCVQFKVVDQRLHGGLE